MFDTDILSGSTAVDDYATHTSSAGATAGQLDAAARSYLAVNCAACHRSGGSAPSMDLRAGVALEDTATLNVTPTAGDLGISGAFLITPGMQATSIVPERMKRLDGNRMPPIASHLVDTEGVSLIGEWIDSL